MDPAPAQPVKQEQPAKPTLADEVYRQLRDLIVSLKLSPGTTLS